LRLPGMRAPVVAVAAHVLQRGLKLRELHLGERGPVLRLEQHGHCVKARSVVLRTVARGGRVDPMQLGGFNAPLPERVLCAGQATRLDAPQDGALVHAARRCGLTQAVAHGVARRRVAPGRATVRCFG
jgi:hypothetical protein